MLTLLALLIASPISASAPAVDNQSPALSFARFLPECKDLARRQRLWSLFRSVEHEARRFARTPESWVTVRRVDFDESSGARWISTGAIRLSQAADPGVLFHEIFHNAFHRSALHSGSDETWGDAFADAFRFAAEREFLGTPASAWSDKLQRLASMSYAEVMAPGCESAHDQRQDYPASLIIKRSGGTMSGLRQLWFELLELRQRKGGDVLDEYFGYSISEGRPR